MENEKDSGTPERQDSACSDFDSLHRVISALQPLDDEARARILQAAATFLKITIAAPQGSRGMSPLPVVPTSTVGFSEERSMTAKEFLLEKQPRTDVERIACLAYYLTHYKDVPYFKTLELSKLNTEAAQPKFSNAANAANNAVKRGYLVAAAKGQRQLSAAGEQFVRALPDRKAAKAVMASFRPRKTIRRRSISARKADQ